MKMCIRDSVYIGGNYTEVFDTTTPTAPTLVGSPFANPSPTNTNYTAYSVIAQGSYLYLTESYYSGGTPYLVIENISNPASLSYVGSAVLNSSASYTASGLSLQGRYAYVSLDYGGGSSNYGILDTVNIANPASPSVATSSATGTYNFMGLSVSGRYAYVVQFGGYSSAASNGLIVYDLGGSYIQQLEVGGVQTGSITVNGNSSITGNESVVGSLTAGKGINVTGNSGFSGNVSIAGTLSATGQITMQGSRCV